MLDYPGQPHGGQRVSRYTATNHPPCTLIQMSLSIMNADTTASASDPHNVENDLPQVEPVPLTELPQPASFLEGDVPQVHPAFHDSTGGYFGALQRTLSGVPPYIWVENADDEPITVVVSKFKAEVRHGVEVSPVLFSTYNARQYSSLRSRLTRGRRSSTTQRRPRRLPDMSPQYSLSGRGNRDTG